MVCSDHVLVKDLLLLLSPDYRVGSNGAPETGSIETAIGMTMHFGGVELL
jgi:enoyl-CoA hydratase